MKDYAGFTAAQRAKAQRWLNQQWASGALQRPSRCSACGQTEGVIDAHAEDYSEPFAGGKTDEFHLCFPCHMIVHCRARNPARFDEYRRLIKAGWRTKPFLTRNWPRFQREILAGAALDPACFEHRDPPTREVLLEIEQSQDSRAFSADSRVSGAG